jgi:hypothetical protein
MTARIRRRRGAAERLERASPERLAYFAAHSANLKARGAAGDAGDMAESLRLRRAMFALDDKEARRLAEAGR